MLHTRSALQIGESFNCGPREPAAFAVIKNKTHTTIGFDKNQEISMKCVFLCVSLAQAKLCNFDLDADIKTCLFDLAVDAHIDPERSFPKCDCSNPKCRITQTKRGHQTCVAISPECTQQECTECLIGCPLTAPKRLFRLKSKKADYHACTCSNPRCASSQAFRGVKCASLVCTPTECLACEAECGQERNGWNPGGQGEGYGEPIRSSMGGEYRYLTGRGPSGQEGQGGEDWHKYLSQGQGGQGGAPGVSEATKGGSSLFFNFTVTGRNIVIESSVGLGMGGGGEQISRSEEFSGGSGGGGGGQQKILIEKGTVRFQTGMDGNLILS